MVADDVPLTVPRGEIFGVVGQSGAGRSTLIRTINSLERPDSGSVLVDGREMTSPAGLSADKQLLVEGSDSAYYNVLAVKAEMKDDPRVQKLYKILTSQEMKDFLQTKFKDLVIPAS